MVITAKQLRQIAAICDALNEVEHNDAIYDDGANDATLINTLIPVQERETNKQLGHIEMNVTSYGFKPAQPFCGQLKNVGAGGA